MIPKLRVFPRLTLALVLSLTLLATIAPLAASENARAAFRAAKSWGYQLAELKPAQLARAPYDVLVIDYSRDGSAEGALTAAEVAKLKHRPDGSRRVVLAYLSIGEAEDYRYYWKSSWADLWFIPNFWSKPSWRGKQNGDWGGNYAVRYWDPAWQDIIIGKDGYLDRIIKAGFDGVWLDKVDSSLEEIAEGRSSARADMVTFVKRIAERGRAASPGFLVVPQNGEQLLKDASYRETVDGLGKEDLLYGEDGFRKPNTATHIAERGALLKTLTAEQKPVLAVEYLDDRGEIDAARQRLAELGLVPHFADRELAQLRVGDYAGGTKASGRRSRPSTKRDEPEYPRWMVIGAVVIAIWLMIRLVRGRQ